MQSRAAPLRAERRGCLSEGSGWRGTSLSLKPLSAEAKRKRARGGGRRCGGVGIKKDKGKWVGHKTNV